MKITRRQLRKLINETAAGRRAARNRLMDDLSGGDELRQLRQLYPDLDDYFNGGWDEEAGFGGEWVVMDEVYGEYVNSGVSTKGELGKLRAYDAVNGHEQTNIKANARAAQAMGMTESKKLTKRQLRRIIRESMLGMSNDYPIEHTSDDGRMFDYGDVKSDSQEGRMSKAKLFRMGQWSQSLHDRLEDGDDLPGWVQDKITTAEDRLRSAYEYMDYKIRRMQQDGERITETRLRKLARKALLS